MKPALQRIDLVFLAGWVCNAALSVVAYANTIDLAPGPGVLAAAIEAASPGDTLYLASGDYAGAVIVTKPLTIISREGARVVGDRNGSVITVDAPDVTISGVIILDGGLSHVSLDAGVKLTAAASRALVTNNILRNNLVGVDIHGAHDARVAGNEIYGQTTPRMNQRGNGVYIWNAPGAAVENNHIVGGRDGIFLNSSKNDLIRGNRMENLRFAIHYMYTLDSRIVDNVSIGNHLGFALMFSSGLVIANNQSIGDREHGVMLNFVNDSEITGNEVSGGAKKCLFAYNANKNRISKNKLSGCEIGIHFTAGSSGNAVWANSFIGNRTQVKYVGTTIHEWSHDGVGNYWSDHAAYDINGDGVADQPFRPNSAMDQILWTQPSARLLLGSPAVQIIRWAQSSFPALLPGGVVDSAPLMRQWNDRVEPARRNDAGLQ